MSVWFFRLTLVLVFLVKKVSRLLGVLTLQSVNSNTSSLCSSSMAVKLTDVTLCWFFTTSTRTSCMWYHNSTLVSTLPLQDSHCMSSWSIRCIILQWLHCPFSGIAFLTSSTKKTLTCKWIYLNLSSRATSWETHYFTELELMELASQHGFSLNGLLMPWLMRALFSFAASGFWRKKVLISLTAKTLASGFVVCWCMVFASL